MSRQQFNYLCGILGIIIGLLNTLVIEAQAQANPLHEMFKDDFTGKFTKFAYMENGVQKREDCKRVIGSFRPGLKTFSIKALRIDADKIPTACLAAQHFWMIFNLEQRGQSEEREELALYKKEQRRLKQTCMVDDLACNGVIAAAIVNTSQYWVQFNSQEFQTKEDYIFHFKTGVDGLETILAWRDWLKLGREKLEARR